MAKNLSKAGMKFRRFLNKLGKYSMFAVSVITCYNITNHLFELRSERLKKEKAELLMEEFVKTFLGLGYSKKEMQVFLEEYLSL